MVVLALAGGLLAACSDSPGTSVPAEVLAPVTGGSMTVGIDQAPTGCNPNTPEGDTWADHLVLEPVLPSAYLVNNTGQSIENPALVEQAELTGTSPETVVYTLNPKAVWSDGVPITAADFVYAWREQRGGPGSGPAASVLGYRDIASVVGSHQGHTVTVVFHTSFADWQSLFADLLPAHVMEKVGWNPACATVDPAIDLSGGPFVIHDVTGGTIHLVANPHWWETPPPDLDALTVRIASNPDQLLRWVRTRPHTVVEPSAFSPSFLDTVGSRPALQSQLTVSSTFLQLEFALGAPATADLRVRQAIAYALDRQTLTDTVVGWADPAIYPASSHLVSQGDPGYQGAGPPGSLPNPLDDANITSSTTTTSTTTPSGYNASTPFPLGADPTAAARLLTAAGFTQAPDGSWLDPAGRPLHLRLVVDAGDAWAATTGELVAAQLRRAGFGVTVTSAPDTTATGLALADGAADLALLPFSSTPYPSQAKAWFTPELGPPGTDGSQDWTGYDDPHVNALLDQAAAEFNPTTAQPLYTQVDQQLWADMVAVPLFAEPSLLVWDDTVYGVGPNAFGPSLLWYPQAWQIQAMTPSDEVTTTTS